MEVILLENIHKLGQLGQQVQVKPGYGRNYLIPKGKAIPATRENIARFEAQRAEFEAAQADALGKAGLRAEQLSQVTVSIARKAGEEGKLYGSVGPADIADAVTATGVELAKHEVRLAEGPLRMLGEYPVEVQLHADVTAAITLHIIAEQ